MTDQARREFEEFAISESPALYRAAWLLCGSRPEAEDLVQETLVKVLERMTRRLGRVDNPAGYAQTTLVRTYLSAKRRRSSGEEPYSDLPDVAGEDAFSGVDLRLLLVELLGDLAPMDRAVVVLRYLDDLSAEEVARHVGLSPGAVRNRCMRALAHLRETRSPAPHQTPAPGRSTT